jgi:hydrogenase nickel incorporation protein HypB
VLLINKVDLLGVQTQVDFNVERVKIDAHKLNKGIEIFSISAKTGEGFAEWCDWLLRAVEELH